MQYETFRGGFAGNETNAYLFYAPDGCILFDAPHGTCDWLESSGIEPTLFLLTHGHYDHVVDVAAIKRRFNCPIGCHHVTARMISERDFFRRYGYDLELEPTPPDFLIEPVDSRSFLGAAMHVFEMLGHCPGSLCFFYRPQKLLFAGDTLYAGSIARLDLPETDGALLIANIKTKIFPLGDDVTILPGHGPSTTIGQERRTNAFVV